VLVPAVFLDDHGRLQILSRCPSPRSDRDVLVAIFEFLDVEFAADPDLGLAERVTVYWIDFKGARVFYNSLAPGESYTQQTYVTHPWIVVDDDGRCLELLVPNAAGTYAVPIGARRNGPA